MSLSTEDRLNDAVQVLKDASTAYVHIQDALRQIRQGNLDVKLHYLQEQRRKLSAAEDHFRRLYSERHETFSRQRDDIVWFECKLAESMFKGLSALVAEAIQEIENVIKSAVLQ